MTEQPKRKSYVTPEVNKRYLRKRQAALDTAAQTLGVGVKTWAQLETKVAKGEVTLQIAEPKPQ